MKNKPKVYAKQNLKNVMDMHVSKGAFAKRLNVSQSQVTSMLQGKPVQISFVAGVLDSLKLPFESLFEVR